MMGKPTKASCALALLAAACWQAAYAQTTAITLPTGGTVAAGSARISTSGSNMQITQESNQAILNWQTFSIGSGAWVNFSQPSGSAVALNRVLGSNPSEIFGRLTANGQVFLTNPGGVLFAPGASVDVGGLFATTLSIKDQDFLAGRYNFRDAGNAGSVVNQGVITVNGYAALAAPTVRNDGLIVARAGAVTLAAGSRVLLDMVGDGLIGISVDRAALDAAAINTGTISACGGTVLLTARSANALLDTVVNNSGIIRADSLVTKNGEIVLCGGRAGVVANSGTLRAAGVAAGTRGGTIKVLGDKVGLFDGTRIDASGDAGGGTVLIGGNFRGAGPEANASHVYIGPDASIKADAVTNGNGGNVAVWSNDGTKFFGSISTRGGAQGGDGGSIETSANQGLIASGAVDLRAPRGRGGSWLLDPNNIQVVAGCGLTNASQAGGNFCSTNDTASVGVNRIKAALACNGSVVQISTKSGGTNNQVGNIDWNADMFCAGSTNGSTLILAAANNITINNFIAAAPAKKLSVTLGGLCGGAAPGTISLLNGSGIGTGGGNFIANATTGIVLTNTTICADTGLVKLNSSGAVTQNALSAIFAGSLALSGNTNFSLTSACNHVGTLAASASGHTVSYRDQGGFIVGSAGGLCGINVGTNGTVILRGDGGSSTHVTQTKPIVAGGLLLKGNATYDLTSSANQVSTLAACSTGTINYTNKGPIAVGCIAGTPGVTAANLALTSTNCGINGGISLEDKVALTGTLTLTTTNKSIKQKDCTPGAISANSATIHAGTGDITLDHVNAFRCIPSLVGGTIHMNVSAACPASTVTVTSATASGALTLNNSNSSLVVNAATAGGDVTLSAAKVVAASATTSGSITITAGEKVLANALSGSDIALTGTTGICFSQAVGQDVTATGTLSLTTTNSAIKQPIPMGCTSPNPKISVTGATTVNAGTGDISLTRGNNDFSSISLSGGAISVTDANNLTVSSLTQNTVNKAVTLIAGGTLTLPASAINTGTAALDLESNGGTLTTAGALSGGAVTLVGSGGISLGHNVTAGDTLALTTTDSAINQTAGRILAINATTVSAGTGAINIAQGNNDFSSISLSGGAISVNADSNLTLNNVTAGGTISIAANGESSDLLVASGKTVSTTNANISLSAGRDVQLAANAAVQTTGAGNIDLVSGAAGTGIGTITVATNGAVSVENGAAKFYYNPAAGYGALTDYSNKVTINACSGSTQSLAWVYAKGDDKTYDRTTDASLSFDTAVNGDPHAYVALSQGTATFDTKNAGTGKTITYSGYGLTGAASSSFALFGGASGTTTGNIAKLDTNVSGTRTYDGSANASGSALTTVSALIGGDVVSVTGTGTLADKNVGTNKAVTNGTLALTGADSGNYNLLTSGNTLSVTKLDTNVSGTRTYDATSSASGSALTTVSALIGGDVVSVTGTGTLADKNVGTNKAVTNGTLALGGPDGGNYNLLTSGNTLSVTVLDISVSGLSASNKVYNANRNATLTGTASISALGTDDVTLGGTATARFSDKNVGTGKAVTVSGQTLSGGDAGNYNLVEPTGLTANITAKSLVVTGLSASGKVYNGNRNATLTGAASISPIGTDDVTLVGTATGRFADKNAGTGKAVTVTGQTISGADAGNYVLVEPTTLKANITQKNLAVTGLSANGKVYNANTKATLAGTAVINPITGDQVTLGGTAVGRFSDKNVGTGKAVTVTGQTLSGADAGNYKLVEPTTLTANITPAKLTYTATPKSVAQGSPITGLTGVLAGLLGSDTLQNSTTGTLRWTTNATSSSPVGSYHINGSGLSATNYIFRQAPGNATALTVH